MLSLQSTRWGGGEKKRKKERKREKETGKERAGTTADLVHFKELSSVPAQNSSGFDSFIYEGGGNRNSCHSIIPSSTAEPFHLSANFPPTNFPPVFTSLSQELCRQQQSAPRALHASSHKHLAECLLLVLLGKRETQALVQRHCICPGKFVFLLSPRSQ